MLRPKINLGERILTQKGSEPTPSFGLPYQQN